MINGRAAGSDGRVSSARTFPLLLPKTRSQAVTFNFRQELTTSGLVRVLFDLSRIN